MKRPKEACNQTWQGGKNLILNAEKIFILWTREVLIRNLIYSCVIVIWALKILGKQLG